MNEITIKGIQLTSYGHESLLNDIKSRRDELARVFGTPDKHGGYICPKCGSGDGGKGTGISFTPSGVFSCWAGNCITTNGKTGGDILKFIGLHIGSDDYMTQLQAAIDKLGIDLTRYEMKGQARMQSKKNITTEEKQPTPPPTPAKDNAPEADYTEQYKAWAENLKQSDEAKAYLAARGIVYEDLPELTPPLGYCPNWQSPKTLAEGKNPPPSKRLIIPTGKGHYLAREITGQKNGFEKMHTGKKEALGLSMLNDAEAGEVVFITEGEFDALSFMSNGFRAIAMGGASEAETLGEAIKGKPFTFLVAGDNDEAGAKATAKLIDKAKDGTKILDMTSIICKEEKDPNEVLANNPDEFMKRTKLAATYAKRPNSTRVFMEVAFQKEAARFQDAADRFTGFKALDRRQGSLYSGLYILFAISSLGKTTLAQQIADNMAAAGHEVLFFSLEMSTHEMICKSINREVHKENELSDITALKVRRGLNNAEVKAAKEKYLNTIADRMNIIEGNFRNTTEDISKEIKAHIERTGKPPIVFIDYLQLIRPMESKRQTTKEVMDDAITELKQIAREYNITIIAISSVNRANYATEVSFEAMKESGQLEYTADEVWGMQLAAVHEIKANTGIVEARRIIKEAKVKTPRRIELACLKNRYGVASYEVNFDYYPSQDRFVDIN